MLRGLLRFVAYALAFWFVYRVVVGALRHVAQDFRKNQAAPPPAREPQSEKQPDYSDVKDARFKDLPKNPPENS